MTEPREVEGSTRSIVVVGKDVDCVALEDHFSVDRLELDLADERAVNAAVFESAASWALLLQKNERVTSELAIEIARRAVDQPSAWGFRIPVEPFLGDVPLRLSSSRGKQEVRLYHKRHAKLDDGKVRPKGTVTRLAVPIRDVLYETPRHQVADYESRGVPHSLARRLTLTLVWTIREGALFSPDTIGYLWRRAAWDLSGTTLRSR